MQFRPNNGDNDVLRAYRAVQLEHINLLLSNNAAQPAAFIPANFDVGTDDGKQYMLKLYTLIFKLFTEFNQIKVRDDGITAA